MTPVSIGQRRRTPGRAIYKILSITLITEAATNKNEPFVGIEYEDERLNRVHPFARLWPVSKMLSDEVLAVPMRHRARVTAGPAWMRGSR